MTPTAALSQPLVFKGVVTAIENVWPIGAELGEGPVWFDDALWFVDIKAPAIHRFEAATGAQRSWQAPQQVGFLYPARSGGFVAVRRAAA